MVYQLGFAEWWQVVNYVYPALKQVRPETGETGGLTLADVVAERRRAVGE